MAHAWRTQAAWAKSYASIILGMAKESFDPISVGEALLQGVAIPAVLHGTEVVNVTMGKGGTVEKLDSIQARFGASLLRVRNTC